MIRAVPGLSAKKQLRQRRLVNRRDLCLRPIVPDWKLANVPLCPRTCFGHHSLCSPIWYCNSFPCKVFILSSLPTPGHFLIFSFPIIANRAGKTNCFHSPFIPCQNI